MHRSFRISYLRSSFSRLFLSAALACAFVVPVATPSHGHSFTDQTEYKLSYKNGWFRGRVIADHRFCRRDHKVRLIRGRDGKVIARPRTNRRGRFRILRPRARGFFYLSSRGKLISHSPGGQTHRCNLGTSKGILIRGGKQVL